MFVEKREKSLEKDTIYVLKAPNKLYDAISLHNFIISIFY